MALAGRPVNCPPQQRVCLPISVPGMANSPTCGANLLTRRRHTLLTLLLRIASGRFVDDPELFRRVATRREGSAAGGDNGLADVEVGCPGGRLNLSENRLRRSVSLRWTRPSCGQHIRPARLAVTLGSTLLPPMAAGLPRAPAALHVPGF